MINYSVIIPIYNMEKYLEECINSIVIQKRDDVEIILINDGSTDNSLDICYKYQERYNNIVVIDKANSGTTDTIIQGIKKSSGKYICFSDADDYIDTNYFTVLDKYIKDNYDIILFNYSKKYINNTINVKINSINYGELDNNEVEFLHKKLFLDFSKYSFYRWDKAIKSEIIKNNILKINEKTTYLEDHVFSLLNLLSANKIIYINEALYYYRMRKNSVSHSINDKVFEDYEKIKKEMFEIAQKNNITNQVIYSLKLYFLYQYARYSLKSNKRHKAENVSIKDIINTKDKNRKMVMLLYKLNLKTVYKILLKAKLRKEKSKKLEYFD
ncbi:MAG: glycosyltransferase [Clostridia bacterium]|nr:glycosyltransferase [Clostridia bacterium]